MSRTINSLRNTIGTFGVQMINTIMKFFCRTVFIYTLGKEFLGISGLYTNVLTILSITELGFSSVITYSLYSPLAEKNYELIRNLMFFYKKVYRWVGVAILGFGLLLMPFLPSLMNGVTDQIDIYQYYLLYLLQTVVSYFFFAYKSTLLIADQKKYVTDIVACACQIGVNLLQMLSLILWKSFFIYTFLGIGMGILQNLWTSVIVDKRYPYLKGKAKSLPAEIKKDLFVRAYATFLQRISTAVGTATDNLIISAFISVTAVGLYSNYSMIVSTIQGFLGNGFKSLTASLGNLYATESKERSYQVFKSLNVMNQYLVCVSSVCFLSMLQPFIVLWAGQEYLLDEVTLIIIVLNFATNYLQNLVLIYRNATGLFVVGKYRSVANAILNLVLSLWLVKGYGMNGVFLGSIISRLVTNWWYDAWVLHRKGFGKSPFPYYGSCGVCLGMIFVLYGVIQWIFKDVSGISWGVLLLKGWCSILLSTMLYFIFYRGSKEEKFWKTKIKQILRRKG